MTQEEKDFMESNIGDYERLQLNFTRNIEIQILNKYEELYQKYIDKSFYVTKWCRDCVMGMLQNLFTYYLNLPQQEIQNLPTINKRGRPKRNENI